MPNIDLFVCPPKKKQKKKNAVVCSFLFFCRIALLALYFELENCFVEYGKLLDACIFDVYTFRTSTRRSFGDVAKRKIEHPKSFSICLRSFASIEFGRHLPTSSSSSSATVITFANARCLLSTGHCPPLRPFEIATETRLQHIKRSVANKLWFVVVAALGRYRRLRFRSRPNETKRKPT